MFLNFGQGILGRFLSALLEVIIIAIVLVLVVAVLAAFGFAVPAVVDTLVKLALVIYFIGRVLGLIGPVT